MQAEFVAKLVFHINHNTGYRAVVFDAKVQRPVFSVLANATTLSTSSSSI